MTGGPWSGQHTAYMAQQPSICFHKLLRTGQAVGLLQGVSNVLALEVSWQAVKPLPRPLPMKLEFVGLGKGISVFSTSLSQGISVCSQEKSPVGKRKCSKSPKIPVGWVRAGPGDLHSQSAPW